MWVAADYDAATAYSHADDTYTVAVNANGYTTTMAQAQNLVAINAYPNGPWSHVFAPNRPDVEQTDLEIYNLIHLSRVNKRLAPNIGKPHVWFCSALQFRIYDEPLVPYAVRTTEPPGVFTFAEDLLVSPNLCEAWGLLGPLEADGAYMWDSGWLGGEDPNGVFALASLSQQSGDNRAIWTPDVPGTGIGTNRNHYPTYQIYMPDYMALGAWKYSKIADIVNGPGSQKIDFQFSTNNGATWYTPPTNGSSILFLASNLMPIVVGGVASGQIAIVAYHPAQSVTSTTHVIARYQGAQYGFDVQGKRPHVFRGGLTAPILIPPTIIHTPLAVVTGNAPWTVTATMSDDVQVASALLKWRPAGGTWSNLPMVGAAGIFSAQIAPVAASIGHAQFEYQLEATDDQGLSTTNTGYGFMYSAPHASALVTARSDMWRYFNTNSAPGSGWTTIVHDVSAWGVGAAPLGYGNDPDLATVLSHGPDAANKYPAYYFRRTFTASNTAAITDLRLFARMDDGLIVYLNGSEIARTNLGSGAVVYTNWTGVNAPNPPRPWLMFHVDPSLLTDGTNVVAAEVHQAGAGSSDLFFDLLLQPESVSTAPENWRAYNDTAWARGQTNERITTNTPSMPASLWLTDYDTGSPLPVDVRLYTWTGGATIYSNSYVPPVLSDADRLIAGKVDCRYYTSLDTNTMTIRFSGLHPSQRYKFALYGSRGLGSYTHRWVNVTIRGADSFFNASSAGATVYTVNQADDTSRILAGNMDGKLFCYSRIDPGLDGKLYFDVDPDGYTSSDAYLQAFMLATDSAAGPDSDADGIPDEWETIHFGSGTAGDGALDEDGDGISNLGEYVAGTDPLSPVSVSQFVRIEKLAGITLSLMGLADRVYTVEYSTNFPHSTWQIFTNVPGSNGTISIPDNSTARWRFYRYRTRFSP